MLRLSLVVCRSAGSFRSLLWKAFPDFWVGSLLQILVSPKLKQKWSVTFPFHKSQDLDFEGLKHILAQLIRQSIPWRSYLHPGTDVLVTVRSAINVLIGSCWVPDLDKDPLHSTSADFTSMFTARENMDIEILHLRNSFPQTVPIWGYCPRGYPSMKAVIVVKDDVTDLLWNMIFPQG